MSINQVVEALENYVTTIATAGGGDKQLFMAAIRQADDRARTALAALRSMPEAAPVAMVVPHEATVRLEWASVEAAHNAKPGPLFATLPLMAAIKLS